MAGQEGNATRERMASVAKQEKWEVEYSRFLNLPPPEAAEAATAACPHLRSRRITKAGQENGGTWLTASASADLKLIIDWCNGDVIMRVEYLGRVLEEHFISKQIFSWPQVSCEAGFAPRGTRVVMVTYRDEMEEASRLHCFVQKFAFRFLSICSLETFLNALKVYMEDARSTMHFNYKNRSDVSAPQVYRPKMDLDSRTPLRSLSPQLPFSSNCEFGQSACPQSRDRYSRGLTQSPGIINQRSFTSGKSYQQAVVEVSRASSSQKPVHGNMRKSSADSSRSKRKSRHATTTAGITADGVPNKEIRAGAQEKENADPQRKMLKFEDSSHSGNKATENGTEQGIEQYLGQPISWHRST
uniref:Poor homologous synapsis 1 PH domain-containing protein n=1 Tax=Kalanchoe fedtschenkoi TaxID=63787 RepID=A0A7N0U0Y9_KALFE